MSTSTVLQMHGRPRVRSQGRLDRKSSYTSQSHPKLRLHSPCWPRPAVCCKATCTARRCVAEPLSHSPTSSTPGPSSPPSGETCAVCMKYAGRRVLVVCVRRLRGCGSPRCCGEAWGSPTAKPPTVTTCQKTEELEHRPLPFVCTARLWSMIRSFHPTCFAGLASAECAHQALKADHGTQVLAKDVRTTNH